MEIKIAFIPESIFPGKSQQIEFVKRLCWNMHFDQSTAGGLLINLSAVYSFLLCAYFCINDEDDYIFIICRFQ